MFGLDVLGGARYPKEIARAYQPGTILGFFWDRNLFGYGGEVLSACYPKGLRVVRVQGLWAGASHDYSGKKWFDRAIAIAGEVYKERRARPELTVLFSPFCEHNLRAPVMRALFAEIRKRYPALILVNSIWKGEAIPGEINEIHSETKTLSGSYINSTDGVLGGRGGAGLVDIDAEKWKARNFSATHLLGWIKRFNLNEADPKISTRPLTPKERRALPTWKDIRSVYRVMEPIGSEPVVPGAQVFANGKRTWKSHAEDNYNANAGKPEDPRERKPVVIMPEGGVGKRIVLEAINGAKIIESSKGVTFSGGGYRYYFDRYGFEIEDLAQRTSGSKWLVLKVGKSTIGPIRPAFRTGSFR